MRVTDVDKNSVKAVKMRVRNGVELAKISAVLDANLMAVDEAMRSTNVLLAERVFRLFSRRDMRSFISADKVFKDADVEAIMLLISAWRSSTDALVRSRAAASVLVDCDDEARLVFNMSESSTSCPWRRSVLDANPRICVCCSWIAWIVRPVNRSKWRVSGLPSYP